ncbi:hypothetical protein [Catenulispora rubra]|uniref:hypothetical protein n=1 Tax=Catenulispora rubra TaxID=280293 RepID=UPI0018924992|nr:hypothetical protein [Catenulispora rubra]
MKAHHAVVAALLLGLAGCSSSGAAAQNTTPATSAAATSVATSGTSVTTSDSSVATTDSSTTASTTAAAATSGAGGQARTDDACTLLTSDQVAAAVGTPGPFTGAHEDPASDGSPVWGCTWGTHTSYADIRQVTAATFASTPDSSDITVAPVSGIGDKARLDTMNPDGRNPEILFTVGGAYYDLSVTVSRSELGATNAAQEASAERMLAKLLVPKLSS